jgi:methionyl-tRNA formyltransferase
MKNVELVGAIHPAKAKNYDTPFNESCAYKFCKENGINQISVSDVRNVDDVDLGISARNDAILANWFLGKFDMGVINCHGGYLPEHKGVGGHIFPIINNEGYTGAAIHWMDEKVDHGDIIDRQKIGIDCHDTGVSLYFKINVAILKLLKKNINSIVQNKVTSKPQDVYEMPSSKYPKVYYKEEIKKLIKKEPKSNKEKRALFWPSKMINSY